ncbi:MAG: hypothetical protein EOO01_16950 [Chitinophagaceae bacterium]|nr:MAG: hypothetical protein EOO01_16950 [Chitinophagaceae bacterium]
MPSKASLALVFLLSTTSMKGQDITGLWQGTLYNDTTQQYYRYEIAISEQKGKLSGFSHTWFILDGKQFYGVKKVKVRRMDGKIIVEDDGLVANNYPVSPAKHIRQLNILTYSESDTSRMLSGPYTTNRTREYRPLTGTIQLSRKRDFRQSSLVPHLEELALDEQLSFVQEEKKNSIAKASPSTSSTPDRESTAPVPTKASKIENRTSQKEKKNEGSMPTTAIQVVAKVLPPASEVASREEILQKAVEISGDTLLLTLFDNGEVDGDTVSVLANGVVIIPKARLSTSAIQYTLDATGADSIKLVLYAENLGAIAPNTGLLVVRDGKEMHEIRFSGNLSQNAAIVFRRKKTK